MTKEKHNNGSSMFSKISKKGRIRSRKGNTFLKHISFYVSIQGNTRSARGNVMVVQGEADNRNNP